MNLQEFTEHFFYLTAEDDPLCTPWKSQEGGQKEKVAEDGDEKDSEGGQSVLAEGEKDAEAKKVD